MPTSKQVIPNQLPITAIEWRKCAKEKNIERVSIHDEESFEKGFDSASVISFHQYLLLRAIYPDTQDPKKIYDRRYRRTWIEASSFDTAVRCLDTQQAWKLYLKSVKLKRKTQASAKSLGIFSLVRYYQLEVVKIDGQDSSSMLPKIDISPPSPQTQQQQQQPVTPTRPHHIGHRIFSRLSLESPAEPSPATSTPERPENLSPHIPENDKASNDRVVCDEQIVNMALLLYLNALTLSCTRTLGDWTAHRKAFILKSQGKKLYEARVDGYFRSPHNKVEAILEVKRYDRSLNTAKIKMQETAQMAAWIGSDPPDVRVMRKRGTKCSRLLVSQDRHEIYVTIAKFDADYVDYICGNLSKTKSFLKMQDYGPFRVDDVKYISALGYLLLAFMVDQGEKRLGGVEGETDESDEDWQG
ncbi:hypothetical protein F4801DRAFT_604970 [Xylaria longipes]|nr:hypothetical protein F4801DRAFT_604970 [Xylaria longipes]RYC54686.1 hypothetical protein CHU98_g11522 [Xylaria longipes]